MSFRFFGCNLESRIEHHILTMAEKYNLNCDTFSDHLKLMFKDLYQEGSHSDVTLVSDDQTQFKAHKIVLSACSPASNALSLTVKKTSLVL